MAIMVSSTSTSAGTSAASMMHTDAAAQALLSGTSPSLDGIPDDILLEVSLDSRKVLALTLVRADTHSFHQIWTLLDDPAAFSRTSKRFRTISQDTYFRARWLNHHSMPYEAIFRAITRPKLFDGKLLQLLMSGGAVLSRNLVQLLHTLHSPSTLTMQAQTNWGSGISFSAYLAVMEQGRQLYGEVLFDTPHLDDVTFATLMDATGTDVDARIARFIKAGRHVPLRLGLQDIWDSDEPPCDRHDHDIVPGALRIRCIENNAEEALPNYHS